MSLIYMSGILRESQDTNVAVCSHQVSLSAASDSFKLCLDVGFLSGLK